jgi:hypothetical protein
MGERTLGDLLPREFENLIFDLLSVTGMENLVWRTPGADGGRDIEGSTKRYDFSGSFFLERWYIEAKKYEKAVGWPTVYEKLSYAENASADYILMVTASSFSPRCVDEVNLWNQSRRLPVIRVWGGADVTNRLQLVPGVSIKYGLIGGLQTYVSMFTSVSRHLAKAIIAASEADVGTLQYRKLSELSLSIAFLILCRSEEIEKFGRVVFREKAMGQEFFDLIIHENLNASRFDFCSLRSLLAACLVVARCKSIQLSMQSAGVIRADLTDSLGSIGDGNDIISSICVWGNFYVEDRGVFLLIHLNAGD